MSVSPQCWAIIPAAGTGQRMASSIPKQYLPIDGKTILEHAAYPLLEHASIYQVIVALNINDNHFSQLDFTDKKQKLRNVVGGETRAHSVLNALESIKEEMKPDDFVLVHDAARPCLSYMDLDRLIETCMSHDVGGILAMHATDTLKRAEGNQILSTLNRENIWRAFTPQMFKFTILYQALQNALQEQIVITDEASAVESLGYRPCIVEGSSLNIKVTCPEDLTIAEMYLNLNKRLST